MSEERSPYLMQVDRMAEEMKRRKKIEDELEYRNLYLKTAATILSGIMSANNFNDLEGDVDMAIQAADILIKKIKEKREKSL